MSDLVKRLRESVFEDAEVVSMEKLKRLNSTTIEAAERVEELERELDRINEINVKHCSTVNTLLIDGACMEERAKEAEAQIAAEKALADRLYSGTDNWADRNAYRKARGL